MTTLTGILEWPQRTEGRVRQWIGDTIEERQDDPFVPLELGEQYSLRDGCEITVEVVEKRSRRRRNQRGPRSVRPVVEQILAIEGLEPEA